MKTSIDRIRARITELERRLADLRILTRWRIARSAGHWKAAWESCLVTVKPRQIIAMRIWTRTDAACHWGENLGGHGRGKRRRGCVDKKIRHPHLI